jgi:hypothetical protein
MRTHLAVAFVDPPRLPCRAGIGHRESHTIVLAQLSRASSLGMKEHVALGGML